MGRGSEGRDQEGVGGREWGVDLIKIKCIRVGRENKQKNVVWPLSMSPRRAW